MKDIIEQLETAARDAPRLAGAERDMMRTALETHIRSYRPRVRKAVLARLLWSQRSLITTQLLFKDMAIALAILVLFGGATSYAAQDSLPGDFLYPVKIGVNEEIRSALAFSAEADARWEGQRAAERLKEAEGLAAKNRLNAETGAVIEANFAKHADRAHALAATVKAKGNASAAAEINAGIATALQAHERTLAAVVAHNGEAGPIARNLIAVLKAKTEEAAEAEHDDNGNGGGGAGMTVNADVQAAAEGRRTAARNRIAEARNMLARQDAAVTAETKAKVQARVDAAERLITEGSARLAAQAYAEARASFDAAFEAASEAHKLIVGGRNAEVNVKTGADAHEGENANGGGIKANGTIRLDILP